MPAIASALVHVSPEAGIRMSDFGLRGDEDFLLIHSVTDRAEYQEEKKVFNLAGKKIYHGLIDPELVFSFDADCLALEGLANLHPGQNIGPSLLNNMLSGAFDFDIAGAPSPWIMYRRPVRTRRAGNIASINFEIVVSNVTPAGTYQTAITSWPGGATPGNTLVDSTTTAPAPTASIFGATIFWRRKTTLSLGTLSTTLGQGTAAENTHYYQGHPVLSAQPANYAAFLVSVDSEGTTAESEIVEVYHVPSGTHWHLEGTPNVARIPSFLLSEQDPREFETDTDGLIARFIAVWNDTDSGDDYSEVYTDVLADLTAFQTAYPDDADRTLQALYDAKACAWLLGP